VAVITGKIIALGAIASVLAGMLLTFLLEYLAISAAAYDPKQEAPSEMIPLSEKLG
jgi:hypothetical protein